MIPIFLFLITLILLTAHPSSAARVGPLPINQARQPPSNDHPAVFRQITCDSDSDCDGSRRCIIGVCISTEDLGIDDDDLGDLACSCDKPCSRDDFTCVKPQVGINARVCLPNRAVEKLNSFVKPVRCSGGSDEPEDDGVCIGVDMLNNFASHELVFKKHIAARVLCDSAGSCATKGHIVNYKGTAMMMLNYCNIVGCKEKVMEVNSPRYQRGLKVESRSEDMHFTAFAARFGTRAEEAVLSTAVRVGL